MRYHISCINANIFSKIGYNFTSTPWKSEIFFFKFAHNIKYRPRISKFLDMRISKFLRKIMIILDIPSNKSIKKVKIVEILTKARSKRSIILISSYWCQKIGYYLKWCKMFKTATNTVTRIMEILGEISNNYECSFEKTLSNNFRKI